MKWYERTVAVCGALILALAGLAWYFGDQTLKWAIEVSEPTFLAFGALSIVLLWAQLRSAGIQEREQNVWKRVVCLHEYFSDVPRMNRSEDVRKYLRELHVEKPPSAYYPLTEEHANLIIRDSGTDTRPPAKVVVSRYLNDWEDFCGAISVGVIDEDYAREMEGARLIDTFFGYRAAIDRFRDSHREDAKTSNGTNAALPFANKVYIELQTIALRWHQIRREELKDEEVRIANANEEADEIRKAAMRPSRGVSPKARDKEQT
jgi:hypothetical protein